MRPILHIDPEPLCGYVWPSYDQNGHYYVRHEQLKYEDDYNKTRYVLCEECWSEPRLSLLLLAWEDI